VADDNDLCRNAMERVARKYTNRVTACEDGSKALEKFKQADPPYDLVLVDYNMPILDGLGLIRAIREYEQTKGQPNSTKILCTCWCI
jgi:CheY-like chemotaxis protein